MDNFTKGCTYYLQEKYELAKDSFTAAIDSNESAINYLARAKTYLALGEYDDAHDDATSSIELDDKISASYKVKGESAFNINEYESAISSFKKALELVEEKDKVNIKRWIRKCEAELNDKSTMEEVKPNEKETEKPLKQKNEIPKTNEIEKEKETLENTKNLLPQIQIYHNYYQSVENLTINILGNDMKNIIRDNLNIDIKVDKFIFTAKMDGKSDYKWEFEFFENIIPSKAKINYYPSKIEVVCVKEKSLTWPTLEKSTKIVRPPVADTSAPKYPSPYAAKKDWETLAKEEEKDELKEKEEGDGLNLFFQQLYGKADPDTRRAMQKSFSTSGGTVLSTNWKEVKEKDYETEIKPPSGLEFKKNL